ncbi:MAG TPA: CoA ester lyase [Stellaceae bacterium]|nr:CoA ester lyase [Stellaceae bacterium]
MPTEASRPRRSALFVPGTNARAMAKARTLPADVLIFDLEDSVAPAAKSEARAAITEALAAGGWGGRELAVRANAPATEWGGADLAAIARLPVDAVLLPKVDSAATVRAADNALAEAGAPARLAIWCMIETPMGVLHAEAIAGASPRNAAIVMGLEDLAKDLRSGAAPAREPFLTALSLGLLAARAHGLAALDSVYADLADDAGFERQCRQGRMMGFDGKCLIHPKTIETANRVFAPAPEAVSHARRVIAAHAEAEAAGRGVAVLDGRMIERLHVDEARRLVALADAIVVSERR